MPTKPRYLNDPDLWMLAEDIPDMDVFFAQIWQSCFVNEFVKPSGVRYKKLMSVHRGYHMWFYYGTEDSRRVGETIAEKIISKPAFAVRVNEEIVRWSDKLRAYAKTIPEVHLSRLTNRDLWSWYRRHDEVHTAYYQWGWIPVAADMFHNNLTERLKQFLRHRVSEDKVNEYLVTLTQPRKKSPIQMEQEEFLDIADSVYRNAKQKKIFSDLFRQFQKESVVPFGLKTYTPEYERLLEERTSEIRDRINKAILKKIYDHYQRYFYVKHMWIGKEGVYSFEHYLKELVKVIGSGVNPGLQLKRVQGEFTQQVKRRKKLMKRLQIREPWKTILDSWGDFMVTKIYRRFAQIYAIYRMQALLGEISKRLDRTLQQTKFMLKHEVQNGLLHGRVPSRRLLQDRIRQSVFYYERNLAVAYSGKQAKKLIQKVERQDIGEVSELHGQVGCIGKASGTVKIIIRPSEMNKMWPGDILVSIATDPDIVPAMKKAAAIVTEQGGITSHAAIVARELNIPCVIGTKIATKVLRDGDRVEVDAVKGIVRKL